MCILGQLAMIKHSIPVRYLLYTQMIARKQHLEEVMYKHHLNESAMQTIELPNKLTQIKKPRILFWFVLFLIVAF